MSTNYKIIGAKAVLGVGLTLKLTDKQASIRKSTLKLKSRGIYIVLEPVEFKQGETITIVDGAVSKSVLANLEDLSPKKPKKQEQKTTKSPAKKDKKPNPTPPATPENDGEDEDSNLVNPDGNDSSNDGDEDSNSEINDESIVDNGDINNLPVATK